MTKTPDRRPSPRDVFLARQVKFIHRAVLFRRERPRFHPAADAPQDVRNGGVSNHLHNMYRDPTNDYGTAWASLK